MIHTKQMTGFAIAGLLGLTLISTPAWADVSVEKNDAGWHVIADAEPMSNVLSTLSKQANIKLSGTQKLIEDPDVSGNFEGSLESVLSRILRGVDYATETVANDQGHQQISRLIVLSGEIGQNPTERAIRTARRIPSTPVAMNSEQAKKDGARVTGMLESNARVAAGLSQQNNQNTGIQSGIISAGSGITRNEDGSFEVDPETQARMAAATQRAQADLQALVNSLRQNEDQN